MNNAIKTYAKDQGGRVSLLLLLFLLAIYELISAGFSTFAVICISPLLVLFTLASFHYRLFVFWLLITINYFIQMKDLSLPFPMSLPNEMFEILLIVLAIIDVKNTRWERLGNVMLITLITWCSFIILEVLNDTCNIGIEIGAWYTGARMMAFQLLYAFIVFSIYIDQPKILIKYLFIWGLFALFAVFWVWKQQTYGFTHAEDVWIHTRASNTHILQGGTLIRYFSIYSDAASFGIGIAATAVAFIIFGITAKVKKYKYFFLVVGLACAWGMFPSGTRTAIACLLAGFIVYIFLSKSFKIAIQFTILFLVDHGGDQLGGVDRAARDGGKLTAL